jgi:hypothetical protein
MQGRSEANADISRLAEAWEAELPDTLQLQVPGPISRRCPKTDPGPRSPVALLALALVEQPPRVARRPWRSLPGVERVEQAAERLFHGHGDFVWHRGVRLGDQVSQSAGRADE